MDPINKCCLGGICGSDQDCCEGGCMVLGNECCIGGGSCGPGNHCYRNSRDGRVGCCTNSACTAYVENGKTINLQEEQTAAPTVPQRPTPTAPDRVTVTQDAPTTVTEYRMQYYYFTVTWTYLYYFYTYDFIIRASTVTSSTETTRTTITVQATDDFDASSEARELTRTMSFRPPASATSLARFTGTTIFDNPSATAGAGGGSLSGAARHSSLSVAQKVLVAGTLCLGLVFSGC